MMFDEKTELLISNQIRLFLEKWRFVLSKLLAINLKLCFGDPFTYVKR